MSDRELVCLSCGTESESFLTECPHCGGSEYRSTTSVSESESETENLESQLAKLSRPVNPLVPA
jgi:predicted ATP-dependent serine protease